MPSLSATGFSSTVGGVAANISDASMVYHVDLMIVAALAVCVAIKLPRALALFATSTEWFNGHILRYVPYKPTRPVIVQAISSTYPPPSAKWKEDGSTDDNHIPYYSPNTPNDYNVSQRLTEKGAPVVMRYPPHIPACIKPLRPLLTPLRSRIAPGFSVGQFVVLLAYFYALIYAGFYKSNVFTDQARTGWIAVAQLPIIFAFAQKNNVLGSMLGYGYEKLNFLHRFAGRLAVLAANIHSLHYFYKWSLDGTFSKMIRRPNAIWGTIALLCIDFLFLFSTQFVRQKAYNFFLTTHVLSVILIIPATYKHKTTCLPYLLACVALYMFDRLARLVKSRITTANVRPVPELDMTRVEIPSVNAGWRAGQHVRLRVLSLKMGWMGWTEEHPFTIASVSENGPEGMVLMCKKAGSWTRNLYDIAKMGSFTEAGTGTDVKVTVEGPYGGPGHTLASSFSAAVFVAGGSGITYALSSIQDLINKDLKGESRVKVIELIWMIPDPSCLVPLLPVFTQMINQSVFTPLRINVFYTKAPTGKQPDFFSYNDASPVQACSPDMPTGAARGGPQRSNSTRSDRTLINVPSSGSAYFPVGLTLAPGRPKFAKIFEITIQRAVCLGAGEKDDERITGMLVSVCGPVGLADDVSRAVGAIDPTRRDQVGGVEICEEVFGW